MRCASSLISAASGIGLVANSGGHEGRRSEPIRLEVKAYSKKVTIKSLACIDRKALSNSGRCCCWHRVCHCAKIIEQVFGFCRNVVGQSILDSSSNGQTGTSGSGSAKEIGMGTIAH